MHKNASTTRTRRWRNSNRNRFNAYMRDYRSTSIERMLEDPEELWFEKEPRKRKRLKKATPEWVDREQIRSIYEKCVMLNYRYPGTGFVVHHIIPIAHSKVCGLHVPENLKIISLKMKQVLGRKFDQTQSL